MNDAVIVDRILRDFEAPRYAIDLNALEQACKLESLVISLGDSTYSASSTNLERGGLTGGVLPRARFIFEEDEDMGRATYEPALVRRSEAVRDLGSFFTPTSVRSIHLRPDLDFRIFTACASDLIPADIKVGWVPVVVGRLPFADAANQTKVSRSPEDRPYGDAARRVASWLPNWSESRLGGLFGVTRQAWRAWTSDVSVPRSETRARLIQVAHAFDFVDANADQSVAAWMEQPLWTDRMDTPESLLVDGEFDKVLGMAMRRTRTKVTPKLRPSNAAALEASRRAASRMVGTFEDDE
jgi:hypothetical protein